MNPPNVRYIEETYHETWPTASQYGSIGFGPVTEGMTVVLPMPVALSKLPVEEQWAWLQDKKNEHEANGILLTWSVRLAMERAQIAARCQMVVIERVNHSLALGELRAGHVVRRNTQTRRPE